MIRRCFGCMKVIETDVNVCPSCGYPADAASEAVHLQPGSLFHNRYIMGKTLGAGGFGVTYLAWDGKLEQKVAIKEYLPSEFSTRVPGQATVTVFNGDKSEQFYAGRVKFLDEAKRLAKFQNEEGIVKIFDSFEENGTAYIVMECLEGMTLKEYLEENGAIPEEDAVTLLMPVMKSLQVVHAEGLLHRDIAPDNIFVTTRGELKLIDFGASRFATTTHSRSLTVMIKPGYSPEEQYRSRGDQGSHTDVYSLAATLYKMVTGQTPPDAMERRARYENQNKDILVPPHKYAKGISVAREIAILNGMNVRIEDRTPDVATFIEELQANPPAKRKYGKIKKLDFYTWPGWVKAALGITAALLVVFGVLLATGVISFKSNYNKEIVVPENMVVVPDVEGIQSGEAVSLIEDRRLIAVASGNIVSKYVKAGEIVLQDPTPGSYMDVNGQIRIMVSSGSGEIVDVVDGKATVPYLIWDTKEAAVEKLLQSGLSEPELSESYDDNVAAGLVISQSIAAGEQLDEGTAISLVISLGPKPFAMPDVNGKTEAEAEQILTEAGLSVSKEYESSSTVKEGEVFGQSIAAGDDVTRGTRIVIKVATKVPTVPVENVVGQDAESAKTALENKEFSVAVVEVYDDNVEKGKVISQTPDVGTEQLPGTVITITVSKGPQYVNVALDANGGSLSKSSLTVIYGKAYGDLPEPSRTGYYFSGWYTEANGGSRVGASTVVSNSAGHTLYAQWSSSAYKVNFNANGGQVSESSRTVAYGSAYGELPKASRIGYTFTGWYTKADGGDRVSDQMKLNTASDVTLYAHWTANSYTLNFNGNGGQASASSKYVVYGAAYGELSKASRTGYTFTGWYTQADGGDKVSDQTKLSTASDVTVYAHWTANTYKVSFKGNGGKDGADITVTYDSTYGKLPNSTRTGYTFKGWYNSLTGGTKITENTKVEISADQVLYAQWKVKTYKVNFDGNGGSTPDSISVTYDSTYGTLPSSSRTGYTFKGWYNAPTGGTKITENTKVEITADQTLYAQWKVKTYKVSFDGNGGSTPDSITVTYGSTYGSLPSSTRDYYTFDGWYTSASGGTKITNSTNVSLTANTTLYAHWTLNDWGAWSGWSTNAVSNASSGGIEIRQAESKNVLVSYRMGYYLYSTVNGRQYRSYYPGYGTYENTNYSTMPANQSGWVEVAPGAWSPYIAGGYHGYNADSITGYYANGDNVICFKMGENYQTQYRYRDRIK